MGNDPWAGTGDVRARVVNSTFHTQREMKKDPQILVDAVKSLSESRHPLLRKIKRPGQKTLLWVPAGVADEEVDFGHLYANDAERMGAAVARAAARLGRPVTVQDVQDEVEADFALEPANSSGLFQALAYESRETFDAYDGKGRRKRATRRVYNVGRAGPLTYYHTSDSPTARSFVELRRVEIQWHAARPEEQLEALESVSLPCVAKGRAMLLVQELETFRRAAVELLTATETDGATRREAEGLKERVEQTAEAAMDWLATRAPNDQPLPGEVLGEVHCWTAAEFLRAVKPFYPIVQGATTANKFISVMHGCVRRVPNPDFENRFSDDPRKAAEFFFDRADALLYSAKRWGGPECSLQATFADRELGRLRDPRFVFPALEAASFEARLAAVACLAFLWSGEGNARLRRMAEADSDAGVRQSALWAYGFAGGEGARELLIDRSRNDPNERVRAFTREILEAQDMSWWRV